MSTTTSPSGTEPVPATGAEELLAAGAVLPLGTAGGGDRAVPLTTRTYRHPALDDRVVVRLVPAELGVGEDLAASFLGLEPASEPVEVGLGLRQTLGFPEWVLAHHPEDGHHALAVVPELEKAARQAKSKPKFALDAYQALAGRLAAAVPHFLPTFYEQAGRAFLAVDNTTYAAQLFGQARKAEAQHGLAIDEDRLDAVFLEFALAGALPVKVLSGYAKDLARRLPAGEALRRYQRLCVRRTAGGLQPSTQMATDLRRLAKAAVADADAAEQAYLAELLTLPATLRAPLGWWKAHLPALVTMTRPDPAMRATLLNLMPGNNEDAALPGLWLLLLEQSGATAHLGDGDIPAEQRPADGTAGWLRRFLSFRRRSWGRTPPLPALYALVEQVAGRLRAELASSGEAVSADIGIDDIDLLDLLLSLDIPVSDPKEHLNLPVEAWAMGEGQRDLLALSADARFRPAFFRSADGFSNDENGCRAIRFLAASPGGRPMLAEWVRSVAQRAAAAWLPRMSSAFARLVWLPGEALMLAEADVAKAARTDLAAELARTLRGGLFDEFAWPAWEEAVSAVMGRGNELVVADAWPHLVVAGPAQARVIGPDGTVLTHDLRIPANDVYGKTGFHYVDGELFTFWHSRQDYELHGYWHSSAGQPQRASGRHSPWQSRRSGQVSLPLPGGGRTTGAGVLHPGDTEVPEERAVISDGTSFWTLNDYEWHEYDPSSGEYGRHCLPGFLADALRRAPEGSWLDENACWLRPTSLDCPTPFGVPVGGLLGWRVVALPDGSVRAEDLSGRGVTVRPTHDDRGQRAPFGALTFPGDERPRAVVRDYRETRLIDPDGAVTSKADTSGAPGPFAAGTAMLPPPDYWYYLRPRDPEGSAVLRQVDREAAADLLAAAIAAIAATSGDEELPTIVAKVPAVLPGVTNEALLRGIAGVTRYAARQQATVDKVAVRLARARSGEDPVGSAVTGPSDGLLSDALRGLIDSGRYYWSRNDQGTNFFSQLRSLAGALRDPEKAFPDGPVRLHFDGPALPQTRVDWLPLLNRCSAMAFRMVAPFNPEENRAALTELLRELDALGLASAADPARWRRFILHLDERHLTDDKGDRRSGTWRGLLPVAEDAFLAVVDADSTDNGHLFTALFHDPSGQFAVPAPYTVRSSAPVGDERSVGWLAKFLAEAAEQGPIPWRPEAAARFAELTGTSEVLAKLIVADLPQGDTWTRNFLPAEVRKALGVKVADASIARNELLELTAEVRAAVVGALVPADPSLLWTEGPDVAAAAAVWNDKVGWRPPVPQELLTEASRVVRSDWEPTRSLPALLDPARSAELSRDLRWQMRGDRAVPAEQNTVGFTATTLFGAVAMAAWVAHQRPAGDPLGVRAALPAALAAVRNRLANPGLLLDLGRYVSLSDLHKVAGAPTEVAEGYQRYGAVIMATHDNLPYPALRVDLLDPAGGDPYLTALRGAEQHPFPVEVALRTARDPAFAALLDDPGDPVAGERNADSAWWPQDPTRSVPALVSAVAKEYGVGEDAAAVYLMLLAMPDPTDRNVAKWTGWKPARLKPARAELAVTDLVVQATRTRAGRSLFLPGGWVPQPAPRAPFEQWKLPLYHLVDGQDAPLGVIVPFEPAAALYERAWQRVKDGDAPRYQELNVSRGNRRR